MRVHEHLTGERIQHFVVAVWYEDAGGDTGVVLLRQVYGRVDTDRAMPLVSLYDAEDDTLVARFRFAPKNDRLARAG